MVSALMKKWQRKPRNKTRNVSRWKPLSLTVVSFEGGRAHRAMALRAGAGAQERQEHERRDKEQVRPNRDDA